MIESRRVKCCGIKRLWIFFSPGGTPEQNPCYTGRHGCDINAVCNPGPGNRFTCQCASGFTGEGRTCYGEPPYLFIYLLTKSIFIYIDGLISDFIWNKKTPRIRKDVLQGHRSCGGLSLPIFQYYYWTSNIRLMLYWINPSDNPG